MSKDPEDRDWKIDKYMSKYKAIHPDEEQPTYEEIGELIDKWDGMNRHITYPMAGTAWNQIEWQRERDLNQYIKLNFPETIKATPLIKPYIKRIILSDETERIIEYNARKGNIECTDIGKPPILRCRSCGTFFTIDVKDCKCLKDRISIDIDSMYYYYRVSGNADKLEVIRDIVPIWKRERKGTSR
jgi:hypothetical protein